MSTEKVRENRSFCYLLVVLVVVLVVEPSSTDHTLKRHHLDCCLDPSVFFVFLYFF